MSLLTVCRSGAASRNALLRSSSLGAAVGAVLDVATGKCGGAVAVSVCASAWLAALFAGNNRLVRAASSSRVRRLLSTVALRSPANSPQQFQNVLDQADAFTLQHFDKASRQTWGVAAGAAALANLPQSPYPGRSMMGMSFGTSNGETAIAAGISHFMDNDQVMFKAGASYNSQGSWSGGIGVGYILP